MLEKLNRMFGGWKREEPFKPADTVASYETAQVERAKDVEQVHVCIGDACPDASCMQATDCLEVAAPPTSYQQSPIPVLPVTSLPFSPLYKSFFTPGD